MASSDFDYESIPVGYYDEVFRRKKGVQSKWHRLKFARIRQRMRHPTRHLDIGCGPGTFIGTLPDESDSVGVDISKVQLRYAQQEYAAPNRRFVVIEPGTLPFAEASFDCVTLVELIEHLTPEDTLATLEAALRVLRPGGQLLVSTPNYRSLWPAIEGLLNRLGKVDYSDQHINRFNRSKLFSLMQECGLQQIRVEAYQFAAPFAAALGWRLADTVARLEPDWLTSRAGLLLLAEGQKPD